jgi:hypothetical protein
MEDALLRCDAAAPLARRSSSRHCVLFLVSVSARDLCLHMTLHPTRLRCPRSQETWPDGDLTTAHFTATVYGSSMLIDVDWNDDFRWYFSESPSGNLSAVVMAGPPSVCTQAYSAWVTVRPDDGKARLEVPVPPELLRCNVGEPPVTAYLLMHMTWVSRAAGRRARARVCACVCMCVRACVCACVCVCVRACRACTPRSCQHG